MNLLPKVKGMPTQRRILRKKTIIVTAVLSGLLLSGGAVVATNSGILDHKEPIATVQYIQPDPNIERIEQSQMKAAVRVKNAEIAKELARQEAQKVEQEKKEAARKAAEVAAQEKAAAEEAQRIADEAAAQAAKEQAQQQTNIPKPVAKQEVAQPVSPPVAASREIYVGLVGGQATIDQCSGPVLYEIVTLTHIVAEHDQCGGWARFGNLPTGTIVNMSGVVSGTYKVVAHMTVVTGGSSDLIRNFGDIPPVVLQTCIPGTNSTLLVALQAI